VLLVAVWPGGQAQARPLSINESSTARQALHALPVKYDPPQNAVLRAPPSQVQIVLNELVNPDISKIVVVDPSNREVDNQDSRVDSDGYTMTVTLPLLPAGTYIVFWRTHSAQDGHVAGGSYLFHIARADGTVPPLSGPLPRGNLVGGAGVIPTESLSGPNLLAALTRWLALAALTLLLGMIFWQTFVQPRQSNLSDALAGELRGQMRRVAWWALGVLAVATLGEVAAQLVLLDGSLAGLVSIPLLQSVLRSRFGAYLATRFILALLGLVVLLGTRSGDELVSSRRARDISLWVYGIALAYVFEYSGHGGAAPNWWGPIVDFLHLLANGIWVGGLLTLAVVVVPTLRSQDERVRATYLAASIPAFSAPALTAVAFVVVTGPLNGAVRMSSLSQVWTTPYGIVLIVKSVLFLTMVAISYHYAFRLRPRLIAERSDFAPQEYVSTRGALPAAGMGGMLARFLAVSALARLSANPKAVPRPPSSAPPTSTVSEHEQARASQRLTASILSWMQAEAVVGVGVLLCAALLGPLAGTLTPSVASSNGFGAQGGTQTITQKADDLTVTLSVDPGKFGTNTFTAVVKNPDGTPASGGSVFLVESMVEMDMGTNTIGLTPSGQPGTYSGQGELPMAGHWRLETVIRTTQDPNHLHRTTFTISVSY
jgi:copper transport protein